MSSGGRDRVDITGVGIDRVDLDGAARAVAELAARAPVSEPAVPAAAYVCTPNAEILMEAQKDVLLKRILNEADLVVADGAGVVLAARLLGHGRIPRAPGFDLVRTLFSDAGAYPLSFYFLGGRPGVAEAAALRIAENYPGVRVMGWHDGFFSEDDEPTLIEGINESGADVLLVALGAPKQEKWIYRNREKLRAPVCIGVGGTLDIFAGTATLAPPSFRARGLEWLYRLYREPWRARRMLRLPQYVLFTLYWRFLRR
ncbi:MAG: WecB/TagA/CpsF family glycosyltransferase [Clostridiales bacterium]|jgi:N-acetylglucosaminyldiphosphoundecaprenol N-acetyl-beta-D-mannosaminyltransferase|nr:WecB/TagA/CpsF family glycosyltransferase [Clostridiales bacterium]